MATASATKTAAAKRAAASRRKKAAAASAEDNVYSVVTSGKREVFSGPEDAAREYVINNFPRLHVEPGTRGTPEPDALIHAPDGSTVYYNGSEFIDPNDEDNTDEVTE